MSYQELTIELDAIVTQLQSDSLDVTDAIPLYERGMAITKQLESHLKHAETTITKIKASFEQ